MENKNTFAKVAIVLFVGLSIMAALPVSAATHRGSRSYRRGGAIVGTTWSGTLLSASGSSLAFNTGGQTYTVNTGNAAITTKDGGTLPVNNIEINDYITVAGTLQGNEISATRITDNSLRRYVTVSGTITAVSGDTFTLLMDHSGSATVHLVSGVIRNADGSSSALNYPAPNERVSATGSWDEVNNALWTTDVRFMGAWNDSNIYQSGYSSNTTYAPNGISALGGSNAESVSISLSPYSSVLTSGQSTTVTATAYDSVGINNIDIFVNGSFASTCPFYDSATSGVCSFVINGNKYAYNSNVTVYAQVGDRNGNFATSSTSTLTTQNSNYNYQYSNNNNNQSNGTVSVSLYPYSSTLANNQSTTITASAYDADGMSSMRVYANGSLVQTCSIYNYATSGTCTYTLYGSNYSYGSNISIYAQATDRYGNIATSSTTTLTTQNSNNNNNQSNGTVSVSLYPYSSTLANNQSTTVTASAYDADGMSSMRVYVNGSLVQTCSIYNYATSGTCTYTLYGSNYSYGSNVSIYAQATDRYGNIATSSTTTLTTQNSNNNNNNNNQSNGTVSVSLYPYSSTLANNQSTTITASAYDADGMSSMRVYANGSLVQTCSIYNYATSGTCTYTLYGSNYSYGSNVSIYAQATDRYGNIATSSTTTLTTQNSNNNNNNNNQSNGSVSISLSPYTSVLSNNQSTTVTASVYNANVTGISIYVNGTATQTCQVNNSATNSSCSLTLYGGNYSSGSTVSIYAQTNDLFGNVVTSPTTVLSIL